jgi:hypothetical protein
MITLPIRYSQLDPIWCTHILGNNTNPVYDIQNYGCLLCCLASVLKYYGIDTDPDKLNQQLKDNGGFAVSSGIYNWGTIMQLYPQLKEQFTNTPNPLTDEQMNQIRSSIDAGYPVIIEIDYNPKTVAVDMHFVTIVAYNPNDENDFTIADPLGGTQHSLKDYLGWFVPSARKTIQAFCILSGPVPQVADGSGVYVASAVFPNIVHGSAQWDQTVNKYMAGRDPKQTSADDLANVVGGIQSIATTANKTLAKTQADLGISQASVTSLTEQLAHSENERQQQEATYKAQINALKPSTDQTKELISTYENRINGYQSQVKQLMADKQGLLTQNATLKGKQATGEQSALQKYFPTFSVIFNKIFKKS